MNAKSSWLKKICTICICVVLILLFALVAMANDEETSTLTITAAETQGCAGGSCTLPLTVSDNTGFMSLNIGIIYNTQYFTLHIKEDKSEPVSNISQLTLNVGEPVDIGVSMVWDGATDYLEESGILTVLTFFIASDTPEGDYPVELIFSSASTSSFDYVQGNVVAGIIHVVEDKSSIKCAQLSLGTDISVNYYADVIAADEGAQMRFTMNGKETLVDGELDEQSGLYVFPFTGITPQCMGDTIKAELVKDGEVLDVKDDYSVLQNCKNLLGKTAKDLGLTDDQYAAMKTLIADLMEYGAAAQTYRKYNQDSLVNEDEVIKTLTPTTFTPWEGEAAENVSSYLDDTLNENIYIYAAGVYFDYCNRVYIKFHAEDITAANFCVTTDAEDAWYRLDDEAHPIIPLDEEDNYLVMFEPVPAFELGDDEVYYDIALNTVKKDKKGVEKTTIVQELYYSIPAYVYSKQDETSNMAKLAKTLYNYGLSAAAYMNVK